MRQNLQTDVDSCTHWGIMIDIKERSFNVNGLRTLYLESILGIQLGSLEHDATEFEGHLTMSQIEQLCDEGMLTWQNPLAPRGHIAYVCAHFDRGEKFQMSIDTHLNTIVIAGDVKQ